MVLLNLTLRDMDGTTAISRMRVARKDTPVLALSAAHTTQARIKALSAGADDVVAHAIDRDELSARMRAIVWRSRGHSRPTIQVGIVTLDLEQHQVTVGHTEIGLTGKEFAILQLMVRRKNMVMTKEAILNHVYGGMDEPEPKIIDVFICKLRKKLAEAGASDVISTVWGWGYTVRDVASDRPSPQSGPNWPGPQFQAHTSPLERESV